ncbi:4Fe-4S binding protein [Thermodesulfobacteriota bacterium]
MARKKGNIKRQKMQWILLWIVVITIGLGWKYPLLGYSVPVVMITGMVVSIFRGRYVCGNLCPRGSFLDRIISQFSPMKEIPGFFRGMVFRWVVFSLLMGFMLYRGLQSPTDIANWGHVFWTMCVVTTLLAIFLATFINARSWCAFCPIGTVQNVFGGSKELLQINGDACKDCKLCEKSCTFDLPITQYKDQGVVLERDCIKCSECVASCPTKALSWPQKTIPAMEGKTATSHA